jgi:hypothetical protein
MTAGAIFCLLLTIPLQLLWSLLRWPHRVPPWL